MFRSIVLLIVVGFGARVVGTAQNSSQCINKAQLLRLQYAELLDVRNFLEGEGWRFDGVQTNQALELFEYPVYADLVRWEKTYSYYGGDISIYFGIGTGSVVVYESKRDCFISLRSAFNVGSGEINVQDDVIVNRVRQGKIIIEFRESQRFNSDSKYSIILYNSEQIGKAMEMARNKEREERELAAARQKAFEDTLDEAESLYKLKQFNQAILKYYEAQEMNPGYSIQSKIEACEKGICQQILDNAGDLLNKKQYNLALEKYEEAYQYANTRSFLSGLKSYATQQINQIKGIQGILNSRRTTVYSYKDMNSRPYNVLVNVIEKDLDKEISQSNKGYIDLNYKIAFDTLGFNNSGLRSFSSSIKGYQDRFLNEVRSVNLSPSKVGDFYVSSEDVITAKLNWETEKFRYLYNYNGLQARGKVSSSSSTINSNLLRASRPHGKYLISVRNKQINGRNYSDIDLIDFNTVGPEASFLSLLMPGMGTLAVTHGQKGWGRFTGFFISSALAIGAKMYSDDQYKKYELATTQTEIDKYYESADISHKVSLAAAGISATIYIHDFFWVLSKGLKNKKEARSLSKSLNNGPIQIQKQSIELQ